VQTQSRFNTNKVWQVLFYALSFVFFFGPVSWLVLASINSDPNSAWEIPHQATLNNYVQLFVESDILLWLRNSTLLAVGLR
jgi:ABC-type spermidine/putrescine transport system permease subunit II